MRTRFLHSSPLLHFAVLGSLVFGLGEILWPGQVWTDSQSERPRIRLEAETIEGLVEQFERRHREAATERVRGALIRSWIHDEILFREALRLGLDRGDPSVSRRLLEKYRPLATNPTQPDAALIEEARAIGWVENDLVIRRLLVERISRLLRSDPGAFVSQEEIDALLAARRDVPAGAPTIDFEHLFLGSEAPLGDPLPGNETPIRELERQSQPFPLGLVFRAQSRLRIGTRFGAEFASRLFAAESGTWVGPLESNYGWHLVRVTNLREGTPPTEQSDRDWAIRTLSRKHAEERLRRHLDRLSRRYEIEVEDALWDPEAAPARGSQTS